MGWSSTLQKGAPLTLRPAKVRASPAHLCISSTAALHADHDRLGSAGVLLNNVAGSRNCHPFAAEEVDACCAALLETYFMQVDHTLTQLQVSYSLVLLVGNVLLDLAAAAAVQNLKTQIAAVESLIAIDLDNRRNELVALNLVGTDSLSDTLLAVCIRRLSFMRRSSFVVSRLKCQLCLQVVLTVTLSFGFVAMTAGIFG